MATNEQNIAANGPNSDQQQQQPFADGGPGNNETETVSKDNEWAWG